MVDTRYFGYYGIGETKKVDFAPVLHLRDICHKGYKYKGYKGSGLQRHSYSIPARGGPRFYR